MYKQHPAKPPPIESVDMPLSKNALSILEKRYLRRDSAGNIIETPIEMLRRVAKVVSRASADSDSQELESAYLYEMETLRFLPSTPILLNAGRENNGGWKGMMFACHVYPIRDSLYNDESGVPGDGILDILRLTGITHKYGGGTGFDFSELRGEGAVVGSTGGRASGPLSFLRIFNAMTQEIKQGGFRRGANMGMLRIDHPDILDWVQAKRDTSKLQGFNLSVSVTDEFMAALQNSPESPWYTVDPHTKERRPLADKIRDSYGEFSHYDSKHWTVGDLWKLIVDNAHATGEPGLFFVDKANLDNPTPHLGRITGTNPCGEVPLLPWEVCCLGSINIEKFVTAKKDIDWDKLETTVNLAVRFLDSIIDISSYAHPKIEAISKGNRKIGLGMMGLANALFKMGLVYGTPASITAASSIMRFINVKARKASEDLARDLGPYPNCQEKVPVRNATRTTLAPTGSISIIAGTSSGIEPNFHLVMKRRQAEMDMTEINPVLLDHLSSYSPRLRSRVLEAAIDPVRLKEDYEHLIPSHFITASEIHPIQHVEMQAALQKHVDNAISKTINMPFSATHEDVDNIYRTAYTLGCKGVTVYRDGCRTGQPLTSAGKKEAPKLRKAPDVFQANVYKFKTYHGKVYIVIGRDVDGEMLNCFIIPSKPAPEINANAQAIGRQVSLLRKHGIPSIDIAHELIGIVGEPVIKGPNTANSIADAVGKAILLFYDANIGSVLTGLSGGTCPVCGVPTIYISGCVSCPDEHCGWSKC